MKVSNNNRKKKKAKQKRRWKQIPKKQGKQVAEENFKIYNEYKTIINSLRGKRRGTIVSMCVGVGDK